MGKRADSPTQDFNSWYKKLSLQIFIAKINSTVGTKIPLWLIVVGVGKPSTWNHLKPL